MNEKCSYLALAGFTPKSTTSRMSGQYVWVYFVPVDAQGKVTLACRVLERRTTTVRLNDVKLVPADCRAIPWPDVYHLVEMLSWKDVYKITGHLP